MAKVVRFVKLTFTREERLMGEVREKLFKSGKTYSELASKAEVANSTVANLANGKTKWPRPKTLFGILHAVGYTIQLVKEYDNEKEAS